MRGSIDLDGSTGYGVTNVSDPSARLVATPNGNVNCWLQYVSGYWRIYVSDISFTGRVWYTVG